MYIWDILNDVGKRSELERVLTSMVQKGMDESRIATILGAEPEQIKEKLKLFKLTKA